MTKRQAEALLRKDLMERCAVFRRFGKDSVLLAALSYNVGVYRLLGGGRLKKSRLVRKLEAGRQGHLPRICVVQDVSRQGPQRT